MRSEIWVRIPSSPDMSLKGKGGEGWRLNSVPLKTGVCEDWDGNGHNGPKRIIGGSCRGRNPDCTDRDRNRRLEFLRREEGPWTLVVLVPTKTLEITRSFSGPSRISLFHTVRGGTSKTDSPDQTLRPHT